MKQTKTQSVEAGIPRRAELVDAVMARNPEYDGRFYYGVLTTGVYCRPSCKSRRPREENLRFFAATADALSLLTPAAPATNSTVMIGNRCIAWKDRLLFCRDNALVDLFLPDSMIAARAEAIDRASLVEGAMPGK